MKRKLTFEDYMDALKIAGLVFVVLTIITGLRAISPARGHEGMDLVSQFYRTWLRPDLGRNSSCCNDEDCRAVPTRRRDGRWEFYTGEEWAEIPEKVLEHNYRDARDTPDGQSHVCFRKYPGNPQVYVFCAVLGSGA